MKAKKFVTSHLKLVASLLLGAVTPLAALAESPIPVVLKIETAPSTIPAGTPVKLNVTITNTSSSPVEIRTASGPNGGEAQVDNHLVVKGASGKQLPRIDERKTLSDGRTIIVRDKGYSRKGLILQPGESFHDFATLTRLFDMSSPGTYIITASTEVWTESPSPNPTRVTVNSVPVQIVITASTQ